MTSATKINATLFVPETAASKVAGVKDHTLVLGDAAGDGVGLAIKTSGALTLSVSGDAYEAFSGPFTHLVVGNLTRYVSGQESLVAQSIEFEADSTLSAADASGADVTKVATAGSGKISFTSDKTVTIEGENVSVSAHEADIYTHDKYGDAFHGKYANVINCYDVGNYSFFWTCWRTGMKTMTWEISLMARMEPRTSDMRLVVPNYTSVNMMKLETFATIKSENGLASQEYSGIRQFLCLGRSNISEADIMAYASTLVDDLIEAKTGGNSTKLTAEEVEEISLKLEI